MKKLFITTLLAVVSAAVMAQTNTDEIKPGFWEHVYMPIEIGMSMSGNRKEENSFHVVTSLEYRPDRTKGVFYVLEMDEHTHPYKDLELEATNVVEGDAQYLDLHLGAGWRQPVMSHVNFYVLAQAGGTNSTLKHMSQTDGTSYHLSNNSLWVPSAKAAIGVEYVFSPSLNIFMKAACQHHLQPTQLEHAASRASYSITAGVNFSLF